VKHCPQAGLLSQTTQMDTTKDKPLKCLKKQNVSHKNQKQECGEHTM